MTIERPAGRTVVGVDETGRGSLFGPVVTCAASFPPEGIPEALRARLGDSKALSPRARAEVAKALAATVPHAFGAASAAEVDALNPLRATMLAMSRAVARLGPGEGCWVVVDGPWMPDVPHPGEALVKADASVEEVMAASILAKEFRDGMVRRMALRHAGYGLERHAGYGTRAHFDAIRSLGPTAHHRRTFLRRLELPAAA